MVPVDAVRPIRQIDPALSVSSATRTLARNGLVGNRLWLVAGTRADQGSAPPIRQHGGSWAYLSGIDHFGAPIEEQLPLRPLHLQRLSFLRRTRTLSRRFAVVYERQRVP